MRTAVFSDVHGNLEAFSRILQDLEDQTFDQVVCLGDLLGYGPDPEAVVRIVRERDIPCILGNHEYGLSRSGARRHFNIMSEQSLDLTREQISTETLAYVSRLPTHVQLHDMYFVHGCPPDSVLTYLFELDDAGLQEIFAAAGWRHCFVGHTHELELIEWHDGRIQRKTLTKGRHRLHGDKQIINIGSVGQPRDGDNRAKYVLFDSEGLELEVRCVRYDIQKTADKILELGFPRFYADRLW